MRRELCMGKRQESFWPIILWPGSGRTACREMLFAVCIILLLNNDF